MRRTLLVALLVAATAALAGCSATVTPPDRVHVDAETDAYAVEDVEVWTSGSTTEYRSQLVVTAVLKQQTDAPAAVPRVDARFRLGSGETSTANATYRLDRQRLPFEEVADETVEPGAEIDVRVVFDPADAATVENATLRVRE